MNSLPKVTLVLFVCALGLGLPSCTSKKNRIEKTAVLEVNGSKVTAKEFATQLADHLKQFNDALYINDPVHLAKVKEQVIQNDIVNILLAQWAEKHQISVTQDELTAEINKIRSNYPNDLAFRAELAKEDIPMAKWEARLKASLLRKKVVSSITSNLPAPTDAEMKDYYQKHQSDWAYPAEVKLTQVVVATRNKAARIYQQIKKGAKIGDLAKQYSIAPEAAQNGNTGWIKKGTLPVFDKAFTMPIGSMSRVLKSPYGFHIYRVVARKPAGHLSFAKAQDMIRRRLMAAKEHQAYVSWLEKQIRSAKILRDESLINAMKVETHR